MIIVYIMDFGIVVNKDNHYSLLRFFETRKIFNIVSKIKKDNGKVFALNYKKFDIDKQSIKKIRYWSNKFSNIENSIDTPDKIYSIFYQLPNKYKSILTYHD